MFVNKKVVLGVMLLTICACGLELFAGDSYLGWRLYSKFSETRESIARKAQAEKEERAKNVAEIRKAAEEAKKVAEEAEKAAIEAEKAAAEIEKAAAEKKIAKAEKTEEAVKAEEAKKAAAEAEAKKIAEAKRAEKFRAFTNAMSKGLSVAGNKILWYLPNRLVDLLDCFTLEAGVGEGGLNLQLTRYATFGANIGYSGMIGWSFNRQIGVYTQRIWNADFLHINGSDISRKSVLGNYRTVFRVHNGPADIEYLIGEQAFDPYAIGVRAGCYFNFQFQFHPVELADFAAGLLFIDFKKDDK